MKRIILPVLFALFFSSCEKETTIYVADHTVSCDADTTKQCLLVKQHKDDEWQNFSGKIEGFTYQEGYSYQLKVKIEKVEKSATYSSGLKYSLLEIIAKNATKKMPIQIQYSATSRGFGSNLVLKEDVLTYKQIRPTSKESEKHLSPTELNNILDLVNAIDAESIEKLEPPTKAHQYDGAPGAVFILTIGDKKYRTPTFDYGNPPEAIKKLIEKLEELK